MANIYGLPIRYIGNVKFYRNKKNQVPLRSRVRASEATR